MCRKVMATSIRADKDERRRYLGRETAFSSCLLLYCQGGEKVTEKFSALVVEE